MPWAIVDLAWVRTKPAVLADLRGHGVRVLLDGNGWRYREPATFDIAKLTSQPYAPPTPLEASDLDSVRKYVTAELHEQAALAPDAYLIPGFIPQNRTDDVAPLIEAAIEAAMGCTDLDPKPFVGVIGAHADSLDRTNAIIDALPRSIAALYLQVTPLQPMRDGPSKLLRYSNFLRAASRDFDVIAGHGGAIGAFLRAVGIGAADAGIAEAERSRSRWRRGHASQARRSWGRAWGGAFTYRSSGARCPVRSGKRSWTSRRCTGF